MMLDGKATRFSKTVAFLIALVFMITNMLAPVQAAVTITLNNTPEENQAVLDALKQLYGDNATMEKAKLELEKLGLLDENGQPAVTATVNIDGEQLDLQQVRELVESEGTDLNKVVSVDGTPIMLGDLKTMIEIEDELRRIKETYFSNVTLNGDQQAALKSLREQVNTEGIMMTADAGSLFVFPSGIDHSLYAEVDTAPLEADNAASDLSFSVTLKDSEGNTLSTVPNYDIRISYRFIDGSAKKGTNYEAADGTLTFTASSTETEQTISFSILDDPSRFEGQKAFVIQYDNPYNILLQGGAKAAEKVVKINGFYEWTVIRQFAGGSVRNRDDGFLTDIKAPWVIDYENLTRSDMFAEGLYDKVQLDLTGTLSVLDRDAQTGGPPAITPEVDFGYPDFTAATHKIYPFEAINIQDPSVAGDQSIACERRVIYNPEMLAYIQSAQSTFNQDHPGHGQFILDVPSGTFMNNLTASYSLSFVDSIAPTVKSISVPEGETFQYGQSVPITVEYSEPVDPANAVVTANTQELKAIETATRSRLATFLYPVKQTDGVTLLISGITGATDLYGNSQTDYEETFTATGIIKGVDKSDAFTDASANAAINTQNDGMDINITIGLAETLPEWLTSEASMNGGKVPSIYASVDGGSTKIVLYVNSDNPTALEGSFSDELNTGAEAIHKAVEFYIDPELGSAENFQLMIGCYAEYALPPVVFLSEGDFSITYDSFPADGVVFAEEGTTPKLGIAIADGIEATWMDKAKDFAWVSNDPDIADIDSEGNIYPTGAAGTVTFTLTARNGGVEGMAVAAASSPLTVKVGLKPFLSIPKNANVISVKSGENAEVRWMSNLIAKNAEEGNDTDFSIRVYSADYAAGEPDKGVLAYEQTIGCNEANPVSSATIPAERLTGVSVIGRHSYIVEISSVDPISEETLTAAAYIDIFSKPAVVKLDTLSSYFITDVTESVQVRWALNNFDALNDAEFKLEITDNADNSVVVQQSDTENSGGICPFNIPKVTNGFKDIYTVAVKAKNAADSTWSYDSFVLCVYSDSALRILIDGKAAGAARTMGNEDAVSQMTSQEILDLKRDIYLRNVISINYRDHAWGQISDQIKWRTSDSGVASINYRQGSLYENIESFSYVSYRPATEFIMSGLRDGDARITATHAATGLSQSVDVHVETLNDKLYLFQAYPQAKTTFVYMNGNGEEKTVFSNDKGELALYEEKGIKSDIFMQSAFNDKEYRGTLYVERLVSGEKDSTKLQLYPVNNFRLREVATEEMHLKKPDGTPYQGDVFLRGGVYKNGRYCPEAFLNGKSGCEDQTVTAGPDGKLVIKMDPTQFWTESDEEVLTPQDSLDFVYELRFPDDAYYPRLITVNGNLNGYDTVHFGTGIIPMWAVPEGEKYKPFVNSQVMDLGESLNTDVRTFAGKVGPGQSWDSVKLVTEVIYWGESGDYGQGLHSMEFEDQYGVTPPGQNNVMNIYPFSSLRSSVQTFALDRDTMKNWLKPLESRNMNLVVYDGNGSQYRKIPMPFRVVNMLDTEPVEDDSNLAFLLQKLTEVSSADAGDMSISDKVIGAGLKCLSGQGIDTQMFGMMLRPTADPTVFKALVFLDIGNMSNDNVTGIYSDDRSGDDLDYTPSLSDIQQMSKGNYLKKQKELLVKNKNKKKAERARNISYSLGGYMEAEVFYNDEKEKWEIQVLNGGFNAGGGVSYTWNYNTFVGPVPVTGQLSVGATLEVIFKVAIQRGDNIKVTYDEDAVNDYLTTLRIYAYFRAFAGFGCDYTVAALKIGLFGQITMDGQFAFLNQPYKSDDAVKGQLMKIKGKVGIEFVAKFLFVSYEKILASKSFDIAEKKWNDWDYIQDTWKAIGKGSSSIDETAPEMMAPLMEADGMGVVPVAERSVVEERDYLQKYDRTWAPVPIRPVMSVLAPDDGSSVKDLQTNAYPYSNPVLTDDGQIMAYISDADSTDVEDTEVRWTRLAGESYPDGTAIDPDGVSYGESQLKIDGTGEYAAAAWVRQSEGLSKEAGDEITYSDVALMSNSTEIMVSVYQDGAWQTTQLTDNASPDLAPVIATNGDRVLVAWRSVYAPDASEPLNFSGADSILYRIYDGTAWNEPQTLYNGTSGSVKGMDAAMLPDGTAAVAYSIDTAGTDFEINDGSEGVVSGMEVVYAVVNTNGEVAANVRLTNDEYLDQNPQIATATFGDGLKWFVLGWHSVQDADGLSVNDIRLCAFNRDGAINPDFIDSISRVNDNADVNITPTFRFVKNAENIDDLSIVWSESANAGTADEASGTADKDVLRAVRFRSDNGVIYITSPLDVAEMPDYSLINHFDAYNTDGNSVKAVILGTNYDEGYEPTGLEAEEDGETGDLMIASPESGLYTASATFQNRVEVSSAAVDYSGVVRGMKIPVQLTVINSGLEPINAITIDVGGNTQEYRDLCLLPNDSIPLTAYYDVPADRIVNPDYSVTADFETVIPGLSAEASCSDTLYLAIPDVGISQFYTVNEDKGKRVVLMSLYNYSDVQLAGSDRLVKIGFYSDPDCTQPVTEVTGQEDGKPFTADPSAYGLIDEGAYSKQFTFDIASFAGAGNEISGGGVQLYAKAWIEEPVDVSVDPAGYGEIMEYYPENNFKTIVFESLLERYDNQPVTISTLQTNEDDVTNAVVTIQNNSLADVSNGNLVVSLLDGNGNILESLQSYSPTAENSGLITLQGEEKAKRTFSFSQEGAALTVSYSKSVLDQQNNANLNSLAMTGIPMKLESGKTEYRFTTLNLKESLISAITEDPEAKVSVNGKDLPLYNTKVKMGYGINKFIITVTAADGKTTKSYTVTINNTDGSVIPDNGGGHEDNADSSGKPYLFTPYVAANNGEAIIRLSSSDVSRLISGAANGGSGEIVVAPRITGVADTVKLDLSVFDMANIANSGASLRFETPICNITLDHDALAGLVLTGGDGVSIVLEKKGDTYGFSIRLDGETVTDTAGGITAAIPVENAGNGTVARRLKPDGTYEIIRYSVAKSGKLLVPLHGSATLGAIDNAKAFGDISNHSLKDSIDFVIARGLFSGTGGTTFSPDLPMTRGMLVTVLGKLFGAETAGLACSRFGDVGGSAFYSPYVEWAARNGLTAGVGGGMFAPERPITNEQLATIVSRFIKFSKLTLNVLSESPAAFSDMNESSGYASEAIILLQETGIITGEGNLFDPKGFATRAQVAQLLEKLIKNVTR